MSFMSTVPKWARIAGASTVLGSSVYLFRDKLFTSIATRDHSSINLQGDATSQALKQQIDNLPEHVPFLLVGAGTASHSAMRAIRAHDPKAKVLMIGAENHGPYMRPALSKELWFTDESTRKNLKFRWWNGKERSIFYEIDEFFIPLEKLPTRDTGGVSIIKNVRLTKLDPGVRTAYLENGQTIHYDKCLLAPGGTPKSMPVLDEAPPALRERVLYFRTADDFLKLEKISKTAKRIVVIGGGLLGSELTCALSDRPVEEKLKNQVITQVYPESGNLGKILPQFLSEWVSKKVENLGAKLIPNAEVKSVSLSGDGSIKIGLSNDQSVLADYIVCAIGIEPDINLAKSSLLEVDEKTGGFLVNSELEARSNVWVAGDASCFYDVKLGRRRVEHHDHAIHSGRLAGQNMVGAGKVYAHQSMFWSDLGPDLSFEAVGIIDSGLKTASVFCREGDLAILDKRADDSEESSSGEPGSTPALGQSERGTAVQQPIVASESDKYSRGVVFYLKDDIIVGVLLINLFSRLKIARRIINEQTKYDDMNEVAKLFNLYLDD